MLLLLHHLPLGVLLLLLQRPPRPRQKSDFGHASHAWHEYTPPPRQRRSQTGLRVKASFDLNVLVLV